MPLSPVRHRRSSSDDSMIPMINIVFLLLIFFMIAGQVRHSASPEIQLPDSREGTPARTLPVRVELTGDSPVTVNGEPTTPDSLSDALAEAGAFTGAEIALMADKHLRAARLDQVLSLFRERGVSSVKLLARDPGARP